MAQKQSNIKRNYIYNLLYRIVTLATPLITSPYISRVLGASGIGQYSYSYAISHYFLIFAVLGVSDYGNREIAKIRDNRDERNRIFTEIYLLQGFLSIIIILGYYGYAIWFSQWRCIALIQGLNIIAVLFDVTWFLFGMELFLVTTLRNVAVKLVSAILILLIVKKPEDVWLYALIVAGSALAGNLSVIPLIRKHVSFVKVKGVDIIRHLKPNVILFLPCIANNLLGYFDKIMIGNISGEAELGYYDNAEKLLNIPNSLITALGTVMLPHISNSVARGETENIKKLTERSMLFILFATFAFAFGISGVAREFVPFFFGAGFNRVIPLVYTLAPFIVFVSWSNVLKTQILLPNGKDRTYVNCLIAGAAANIVLNYVLIPEFGAIGAAVATTIAEGMIAVLETIALREKCDSKRYIRQGIPFIAFGIAMFAVIYHIHIDNIILALLIKIIIGATIYLTLSGSYLLLFHRDLLKVLIPRKKDVKE